MGALQPARRHSHAVTAPRRAGICIAVRLLRHRRRRDSLRACRCPAPGLRRTARQAGERRRSAMSTTGRRFGRWRVAALVAAGLGLALAALVIAFDWNWMRPNLERYLAEKSQRSVRIGDFHVSLSSSLDPTLRFRAVRI